MRATTICHREAWQGTAIINKNQLISHKKYIAFDTAEAQNISAVIDISNTKIMFVLHVFIFSSDIDISSAKIMFVHHVFVFSIKFRQWL